MAWDASVLAQLSERSGVVLLLVRRFCLHMLQAFPLRSVPGSDASYVVQQGSTVEHEELCPSLQVSHVRNLAHYGILALLLEPAKDQRQQVKGPGSMLGSEAAIAVGSAAVEGRVRNPNVRCATERVLGCRSASTRWCDLSHSAAL